MKHNVALEAKICIITGEKYSTDSILVNKQPTNKGPGINEGELITGYGISPKAQKKLDKGYVALVGINEEKSKEKKGKVKFEDAYRTGKLMYIKGNALEVLGIENNGHQIMFVGEKILKQIQELYKDIINLGEKEGVKK